MALPAHDNFVNGDTGSGSSADGTNLATYNSNWTVPKAAANFQLNSNAVVNNVLASPDGGTAYWNADSFNADQYSQAVITWTGSPTSAVGVGVRLDANGNGYGVLFVFGNGQAQLYRISDDGFGHISYAFLQGDGGANGGWVSGDTMRLEISGTTLTLKKNGVVQTTYVDATYATGSAGLFTTGVGTNMKVDNWQGDNLGGGGGGGGTSITVTRKIVQATRP